MSYTQSDFALILNCTSTHLLPTTVAWIKDRVEVRTGDMHCIYSQRVIDVESTVYENTVLLIGDLANDDKQGLYQCTVQCYDDIGSLVSNGSVQVSVTGKKR